MDEKRSMSPPIKRYRREELDSESSSSSDDEDIKLYVPVKERLKLKSVVKPCHEDQKKTAEEQPTTSLLEQHASLKQSAEQTKESLLKQQLLEEEELLKSVTEKTALKGALELAKDISYTETIKTSWRPPSRLVARGEDYFSAIRAKFGILVEGEQIPPPCTTFEQMKLLPSLIKALKKNGISKPSPIQIQAIPVVLSGRDLIGVAHTGSGKTLVFILPILLLTLEQQLIRKFIPEEGPYALVVCPSRELARQSFEIFSLYGKIFDLKIGLVVGGGNPAEQAKLVRHGLHIIVATPGRLLDMLRKQSLALYSTRILVLDEADRMIDLGFEEDVRNLFSFFKGQRQSLLFSATMPKKILSFARSALVKPVTVNVGRAGAANARICQQVEYVRQEDKIARLLPTLAKTSPPVLIFAFKKQDVDAILEYLLLKGVAAVAVHADKLQEERTKNIDMFKKREKDVLVATDVASKGLDFQDVQHVINFDMPDDIEDYVHRIGRTARSGKKGMATTFVNKSCSQSLLLDLKHLLLEAGQELPPFLQALESEEGEGGCSYCGGLGHRITACPKLDKIQGKKNAAGKDFLANSTSDW